MCQKEARLGLEAIVEWIELNFHHTGFEVGIELKRKTASLTISKFHCGRYELEGMTMDKVQY